MNKLWEEWLTLHHLWEGVQPRYFQGTVLTAPFMSSDSGFVGAAHKLLYVGQATYPWWYDEEFKAHCISNSTTSEIIAERQERNREAIIRGR